MPSDAKRKEARKRKFAHLQRDEAEDISTRYELPQPSGSDSPKEHKLENSESVHDITTGEHERTGEGVATETANARSKPSRFICFIGNLPFTASTETIAEHFEKVKPSIRHSTSKDTGKSRGFAFLEFEGYDRMKTCLKLFHQSKFDDGISPARIINVELTAGGGGSKSIDRKAKLRAKNDKLNEARIRRLETEQGGTAAKTVALQMIDHAHDDPAIHPSRRKQMQSR